VKRFLASLTLASLCAVTALPAGAGGSSAVAEFPQGVAARAGIRRAILWTRVSEPGMYQFSVSGRHENEFYDVAGSATARAHRDLTIHVTLRHLRPGTRYTYRFTGANGAASPQGTFRTAPRRDSGAALKLAFSGDSDVYWTEHPDPSTPPFAVLDRIRRERPDLFVYLGDTIYSDSEAGGEPALTRAEKWAKYRDNRIGPTRRLLRATSTRSIWDDHETINDYDGAELINSDPDLMKAGLQAFSDYWPVPRYWPLGTTRTYGKLDWGRNIDILFLDERTFRSQSPDELTDNPCRDAEGELDLAPMMPPEDRAELGMGPADPACIDHILEPDRTLLGGRQLRWLKRRLQDDSSKWKLIVNQVPIVQLFVLPYDRWEGYAAERADLLQFIADEKIEGVVFLTTDIHANIGSPTFEDILVEGAEPVAYEVVTGPMQTCTLDCEVDRVLGFDLAGELMRGFLVDHDLVYNEDGIPHCAAIDEYGYSVVSTDARAARLRVEWRSSRPTADGRGRIVGGCPPRTLRP
jgi:phosphodiesterase/alkaline phosphatase D-like protein